MGTLSYYLALDSDYLVSNPLGWDGDIYNGIGPDRFPDVSNPLGWDGDRHSAGNYLPTVFVSNPLGWDGDVFIHFLLPPS